MMSVYLLNLLEAFGFAVLAYDARKGRAKHVSAQTCVALSISVMLGVLNLSKHWDRMIMKLVVLFLGTIASWTATYNVAKGYDAEGEDDVPVPGLSSKMRKASVYLAAAVGGTIAFLVAHKFVAGDALEYAMGHMQAVGCTFQSFLYAFGLMPQLVLSRKQGFVAPAAVRFLLVEGIKHFYEFLFDASVSYRHFLKGRATLHEVSYMSGDFIAALVLMDFLYLIAINQSKVLLWRGQKELELPDNEDGCCCMEPSLPSPATCAPESSFQIMMGKAKQLWNDQARLKNILALAGIMVLATAGTAMGLVNIYAALGAGAVFAGVRWMKVTQPCLPIQDKQEKCCV